MRRILDLRIVRWQVKLLYIVAASLVTWPFTLVARATGSGEFPIAVVVSAFDIAAILFGARIFRGNGEPLEPFRPWWKMTARRPLSVVLGIFSLIFLVTGTAMLAAAAIGVESAVAELTTRGIATSIVNTLFWLPISFLYLNSAAHVGKPEPIIRIPRFKPPMKLK